MKDKSIILKFILLTLFATCSCSGGGNGEDSENTAPPSISFEGETISYDWYTPVIVDINNDGYLEALGTINDGSGSLTAVPYTTLGLSSLFADGRVNRDCRVADFNGDGYPDIVCNTYSPSEAYSTISAGCNGDYNPESKARLFFNNGDGTFTESDAFSQLYIRGFGETILVADFNNDGALDIFLPYYSQCSPNEHSYLLINDGHGVFYDVSTSAGIGLKNRPVNLRVEGAQALDFNLDGWIDFYAAGHLFMNNGDLTFNDVREELGLPELFDEGIKFLDWNNDGYLDLVIHHPSTGPALYEFDGQMFNPADVVPSYSYEESYGMNIYDLNNDGREDIFASGGSLHDTVILLNNGKGFERSKPTEMDSWGNDIIAFADIDRDGRIDVIKRVLPTDNSTEGVIEGTEGGLNYYRNNSSIPENSFFYLEVVGSNGERNQQGRVVKIIPQRDGNVTFTRVIESGSGYMAQNQYELLVGTPYTESHSVQVFFPGSVVEFIINPGERKRVFQDGRIESY
ncbi:MAG: VCBS repeat-containing protein [Deltaproteobacteria bacterium]|nr:VCBS repeat-containing protein [Deltaproteobacteria bacterium]